MPISFWLNSKIISAQCEIDILIPNFLHCPIKLKLRYKNIIDTSLSKIFQNLL